MKGNNTLCASRRVYRVKGEMTRGRSEGGDIRPRRAASAGGLIRENNVKNN